MIAPIGTFGRIAVSSSQSNNEATVCSLELLVTTAGQLAVEHKSVSIEDFRKVFEQLAPNSSVLDDVVEAVNTFQTELKALLEYMEDNYKAG